MPDETYIGTTPEEAPAHEEAPVEDNAYHGVVLNTGLDIGTIAATVEPQSNTPNSNVGVPCKGCSGTVIDPSEPVLLGGWGMSDADIQRVYLSDPSDPGMVAIGNKLTEMNATLRETRGEAKSALALALIASGASSIVVDF